MKLLFMKLKNKMDFVGLLEFENHQLLIRPPGLEPDQKTGDYFWQQTTRFSWFIREQRTATTTEMMDGHIQEPVPCVFVSQWNFPFIF